MKLEQSFEVKAPIDRVWAALIDVERVAPCLPGAEITESGKDGAYRGSFTVKLGPTTASYRGELKLASVDEASRTVTMWAIGQDKRGQGSAKATIVSVMREQDGATIVKADTDFTITGRLARFGRGGMIQDISNRLLRDFSACLAQTIEAEQAQAAEPEPVPAGPPATSFDPAPAGSAAPPRPPAPRPASSLLRAKPVEGASLLRSVLVERIRRLVERIKRLRPAR